VCVCVSSFVCVCVFECEQGQTQRQCRVLNSDRGLQSNAVSVFKTNAFNLNLKKKFCKFCPGSVDLRIIQEI
jgi:hypothetical protein